MNKFYIAVNYEKFMGGYNLNEFESKLILNRKSAIFLTIRNFLTLRMLRMFCH